MGSPPVDWDSPRVEGGLEQQGKGRAGKSSSASSFRILGVMPSGPGALGVFRFSISFLTTESVMVISNYLHHKVIGRIAFTCVSLSVCLSVYLSVCLSVTPTLLP